MSITEQLRDRYSEPDSDCITIEAVFPDIVISIIIILLIDSWYFILSGKIIEVIMENVTILMFIHIITAIVICILTILVIVVEGPEIASDIWDEVKDWKIFTFK